MCSDLALLQFCLCSSQQLAANVLATGEANTRADDGTCVQHANLTQPGDKVTGQGLAQRCVCSNCISPHCDCYLLLIHFQM